MISQTAMVPSGNLGLIVLTNSETGVNTIMQNKIFDVFTDAPKRDWSAERLGRAKQNKAREAKAAKKLKASYVANSKLSLSIKDYAGNYIASFTMMRPSRKKTVTWCCALYSRRILSPIWSIGALIHFKLDGDRLSRIIFRTAL